MVKEIGAPRIILVSQWPDVKNGEYELIEKIRQTGFKIAVVDYFGFDVSTGRCINYAGIRSEYDFAISFHYDTPKFLNIPTFLWVANPLEFMHLRGDYRSVLIHHIRAYDDYLYNGSELLTQHIKRVVGRDWSHGGLEFFASSSSKTLLEPCLQSCGVPEAGEKIFYCGVNWERGIDKSGRAQGLLDILQEKNVADFYGPAKLEGINPWEGFTSYRGEIPFDGLSMSKTMQAYAAVLAVSSPAHIKSQTSSSRVFEGVAAGVPVISDRNSHVQKLFGDLIYYFDGATEQARAESVVDLLNQIRLNPDEARARVAQAQKRIAENYSFEVCLEKIQWGVSSSYQRFQSVPDTTLGGSLEDRSIDIFLFYHAPYADFSEVESFPNLPHILEAASVAIEIHNVHVRLFYYGAGIALPGGFLESLGRIELVALSDEQVNPISWHKLRLGEKVQVASGLSRGDFAVFLTQSDYPHYDYFLKPIEWLRSAEGRQMELYSGGFFANDLSQRAPKGTAGILRNNSSNGLYRWTQNSIAEHQLGQLFFSRQIMERLDFSRMARFDVLFPIAVIMEGIASDITLHRDRHILLRVRNGYFHSHYNAYTLASMSGFWSQHYELLSNYSHELNALYDAYHEYPAVVTIADQVSGHSLPQATPIDPAVHVINQFIGRLRPLYRFLRKIKRNLS